MYRINDKESAIREVQKYLKVVSEPNVFISPSGVFDERTKLAVIDFQEKRGIFGSGVVDLITFDHLFTEYTLLKRKDEIGKDTVGFIQFPILPGAMTNGVYHINQMLTRLLDYYGVTHRLRPSAFFSEETRLAVRSLREIYMLEDIDIVDEILYSRIIDDINSISNFSIFE